MAKNTVIKKIYVISHTHWDREWYEDFQGFRTRLVYTIDELIRHMEEDPEYKYFTMDGQTIMLDDYLEIRPENRERLTKLIQSGRIVMGPWYVMPDEFLVSGESLIRNLMKGMRDARKWGVEAMMSGYVTDVFGHNSQFPQILKGFGIDNAVVFRGFHGDADPAEFCWEGADGSRVLGLKLDEDRSYSDFYFAIRYPFFDRNNDYAGNMEELIKRTNDWLEFKNKRSTTDISMGLDGVDHVEIEPQLDWLMKTLTKESGVEFVHETLEQYLEDLRPKVKDLQVLKGEQRALGFKGINNWVPENVLSSRIHLKQHNQNCELLLEKWAEPLGVMTAQVGRPYPSSFLVKSWETLLQNHPHDSICGCSIDQVHRDMMYRFDQSRSISTRMIKEEMYYISDHLDCTKVEGKQMITVFNTAQTEIDGVIELELDVPAGTDASLRMLSHNLQGTSFRIYDPSGEEIPYQLMQVTRDHLSMSRPYRELPREKRTDRFQIVLHAKIPSFGYTAYTVEPYELDWYAPLEYSASKLIAPVRNPGSLQMDELTWDNGRVQIKIQTNGTLDVLDHDTGHEFNGILYFEDEADIGDGWTHMAPVGNEKVTSLGSQAVISIVYDGPYAACLRIQTEMKIPKNIQTNETMRSSEWIELPITTFITLLKNDPKIYCRTVINNEARDHRLKALFPTRLSTDQYATSTPFDLVKRTFVQKDQRNHLRKAYEAFPHNGILTANDGSKGLAIYSKGLYEACVNGNDSRTLELTLFRSTAKEVGTDRGEGGQLLQSLEFEYAFQPFEVNDHSECQLWIEHQRYVTGVRSVNRPAGKLYKETPHERETNLPLSHSYMQVNVQGLIVSSVKEAEDEKGSWIIRLFNTTNQNVSGNLVWNKEVIDAQKVNLDEQIVEQLQTDKTCISIKAGPREIVSIKVRH